MLKYLTKKSFFSLALSVILLFSFSSVSFAAEEFSYESGQLENLLNDGLTKDEALRVLHFEDIKNKLTATNQLLDFTNGQIVIKNKNGSDVKSVDLAGKGLSNADIKFLQNDIEQQQKKPKVSKEAKDKEIKAYFEKNPTAVSKKFNFEDGTWVEVNTINERIDEIKDDKVSLYELPNERELATKYWPSDGTYSSTAEWKEYSGVDYTKIFVTQTTYVSNDQHHVEYNGEYSGKSNTGITSASDAAIQGGGIRSTDYNSNPQIWTLNVARSTFTLTVANSVSFAGIYSFTVNQNSQWDKYVSIRCSLVASHYYSGIYGVGIAD